MSNRYWSKDELELLKKLYKDGKSYKDISKKINRTKHSIRFKIYEMISDEVLEKNSREEKSIITIEEKILSEKEKQIRTNELKVHNELLKKQAKMEIIVDKIVSSIKILPDYNLSKNYKPKIFHNPYSQEEAGLILSDLHIGSSIIGEEINIHNNYNIEIFKKRLNNLMNHVISIVDRHRSTTKIDVLNIFCLGDFCHGMNDVGNWGSLNIEQDVVNQLFSGVDEIGKILVKLSSIFNKIKIWCVYGNHGRCAKLGIEKPYVNWDYLLYEFLKARLSNNNKIEFSITKANFMIVQINGIKFLLIHGDGIKSWGGIPFYGISRTNSRFRSLIDSINKNKMSNIFGFLYDIPEAKNILEMKNYTQNDIQRLLDIACNEFKNFDYLLLGHFHQFGELEESANRIIISPSFSGADSYAINNLRLFSQPAQVFFGIHKKNGLTWRYVIDLEKELTTKK